MVCSYSATAMVDFYIKLCFIYVVKYFQMATALLAAGHTPTLCTPGQTLDLLACSGGGSDFGINS